MGVARKGWHDRWVVVVTGVIRGEDLLTRPEDVGELQEGDLLEVRPIIDKRVSFVSYDAEPGEVEDLGVPWPGVSPGKTEQGAAPTTRHQLATSPAPYRRPDHPASS